MGRGDERRRHFPPGSKALAAAVTAVAAAASLSSRGVFESVSPGRRRSQTAWRVESTSLLQQNAQRVHGDLACAFRKLQEKDLFIICDFITPKWRTLHKSTGSPPVFLHF